MTIDEAIKNEEEIAIQQIEKANALDNIPLFGMSKDDIEEIKGCYKCSKEHEQLAEWLKELKSHREAWNKMQEEIEKINPDDNSYSVKNNACLIVSKYRPKEGDAECPEKKC